MVLYKYMTSLWNAVQNLSGNSQVEVKYIRNSIMPLFIWPMKDILLE
jgi:hypothetical protein